MTYLPTTDAGVLNWARNFRDQIAAVADPTTIGLSAAAVTEYEGLVSDYTDKYAIATDSATRGGSTINAKNIAKKALITASRTFGQAVTRHPGVTNEQRYDMGLTVRDDEPTPVPVPTTKPVFTIATTVGRTITMRIRDEHTPDTRARPEGIIGATIMMYVGDEASQDPMAWTLLASTSKTNVTLDVPLSVPADSRVWIAGFWYNTKSQSGPVSDEVSTVIRAAVASAA